MLVAFDINFIRQNQEPHRNGKACRASPKCFWLSLINLISEDLPYFFAYKTVFFSFQNNPKNLDPSYKTDLDLWDCLGRVKPV